MIIQPPTQDAASPSPYKEQDPLRATGPSAAAWVVKGLGPIRHAELRPAKLTLFVGDNNSGKSYLATLLWGLWRQLPSVFYQLCSRPPAQQPDELKEMLQICQLAADKREVPELFGPSFNRYQQAARKLLEQNLSLLTKSLFNSDQVAISSLQSVSLEAHWDPRYPLAATPSKDEVSEWLRDTKFICSVLLTVCCGGVLGALRPVYSREFPSYLPAARTGFMLLSPAAMQYGLDGMFGSGSRSPLPLTLPATEFLKTIATGFRGPPGPFAEEAAMLERELGGRLAISGEVGVNQYRFQVQGGQDLPVHLVSSLVTELAPIILTLRHADELPFLVIEEPEAHLHPRLQRVLARVLVRLVRKGTRVLVTTHSDLLCQQFNNFMRLGMRSDAERKAISQQLGYEDSDYLTAEEVHGYSFARGPEGTEVTELPKSEYGVAMPTFNDELDRLLNESRTLDETEPTASGGASPV